jgi:hypothetical protein
MQGLGQDSSGFCTANLMINCASPSASSLHQSYTPNEGQDFSYEGVSAVAWFHKIMAQMTKS